MEVSGWLVCSNVWVKIYTQHLKTKQIVTKRGGLRLKDELLINRRIELHCTVNRFFMKLFKTSNIEVVKNCQIFFNFELPRALLVKTFDKFIACSDGTDVQFSSVCDIW